MLIRSHSQQIFVLQNTRWWSAGLQITSDLWFTVQAFFSAWLSVRRTVCLIQ